MYHLCSVKGSPTRELQGREHAHVSQAEVCTLNFFSKTPKLEIYTGENTLVYLYLGPYILI